MLTVVARTDRHRQALDDVIFEEFKDQEQRRVLSSMAQGK